MEIIDGTKEGLIGAIKMIMARPHPSHLEEYRIAVGEDKGIGEMIFETLKNSSIVLYDVHGDEAMIGGIGRYGMLRHLIWMLTTATAADIRRSRVWLARKGRELLSMADKRFPWPNIFYQVIPEKYVDGLNYARHMGFKDCDSRPSEACPGEMLVTMERMVPR